MPALTAQERHRLTTMSCRVTFTSLGFILNDKMSKFAPNYGQSTRNLVVNFYLSDNYNEKVC